MLSVSIAPPPLSAHAAALSPPSSIPPSTSIRSSCSLFWSAPHARSMATDELAEKLHRRLDLQQGAGQPPRQPRVFNPYTEFKEFSRKQIKDMEQMFKR